MCVCVYVMRWNLKQEKNEKNYCRNRESNTGPQDLQSCALPTVLIQICQQMSIYVQRCEVAYIRLSGRT